MPEWIIAVDAMGGDNAPRAVCEGALQALREMPEIGVRLYGRENEIRACLGEYENVKDRLEIVHAEEVIDMHESPMMAVRKKTDSSLVKAMLAVKNGEAQAFVSAGSTGAVLAGGMTRVGRIRGIERPALATVFPGRRGLFMLIDCGANVDCQPKYLTQFGLMGKVYMENVLGMHDPAVGLVNIGAEDTKGNALSKETYQLMKAQSVYRFAGNVEARDIPLGEVQVVVCDGFDGNLILKYTEGLSSAMVGMLKEEMLSSLRTKLGAALVMPALKRFKGRLSAENVGGAPLLGVNGAIIKAHGNSNATAFKNAIRQARDMLKGRVTEEIQSGLQRLLPEEG